jgi:serine/threonine-protein kinase
VLEQTPAGGGRQKKGTDVLLAISAGKKTATVPQVSGLTPQEARVAIENAGFQLGRVVELTSDYPRGTVYAVTPAPGTQIDLPAEVNLTVSAGPSVVQAPDLVGREIPDARSVLEQSGLRLGAISRDTSSTQTENTVLHQNPPAGTAVPAGSLVSVTVSRFPAVRPLPPPSSTFDSTVFRRKIPAP